MVITVDEAGTGETARLSVKQASVNAEGAYLDFETPIAAARGVAFHRTPLCGTRCVVVEFRLKSTMMISEMQNFRWLGERLPSASSRRLVTLTGARQVGKTTLAKRRWPTLRYVSLDVVEEREALRALPTRAWSEVVGEAILDEVQKEPSLFDKVKFAYDEGRIGFSALLGSSRIQLLERVRESLAGRTFVYELWPLMPSEIRHAWDQRPATPLLDRLLTEKGSVDDLLSGEAAALLGDEDAERRLAIAHLEAWGGMPELLRLSDADRREWLRSYQQTFVERDLADLARLSDLLPFRALQRVAMLRTGQLLNTAEVARDAALPASTARRYLEYLRLTWQAVLLPPYTRNLTSAVVKSPKLYWVDLGLWRQGTGIWGPLDGAGFETLVVSEAQKWVSTLGRDARLSFYRTHAGLEVDLLIETDQGVIGVEVKNRAEIASRDLGGLRAVAEALGPSWRGGVVVNRGSAIARLDRDHRLWAVPVWRLF